MLLSESEKWIKLKAAVDRRLHAVAVGSDVRHQHELPNLGFGRLS